MSRQDTTARRRAALCEEALELIVREHASALTLSGVARRIATSDRQLQRALAEAGGTTFRDALTKARMDHARELLRGEPDTSVREVALRVGYEHPAQFAKAFRRYHGMTPTDCRAGAG